MKKLFADRPLARLLFMIARMLLMVYVGFSLYLAFFQRRVLYYPTRAPAADLTRLANLNGLAPWHAAEDHLIGWQPTNAIPDGANLLLVFHGNAGFALHRTYLVDGFQTPPENPALHVFLFEYPGYGARPGSPSETAIKTAASQAFKHLRNQHPHSRIFLAGESLGGGVGAWLAGKYPDEVAGIFLITAFNRLADVARHHYPILPVNLLLRERYESSRALENYHGPVGILLAEKDNVIPARFGIALYEAYQGPKKLWVQENRNHNTLDYGFRAKWWAEAKSFLLE